VIKVVTAYPRIMFTTLVVVGGTAVTLHGFGISLAEAASGTGNGISHAYRYIKAASLASVIGGLVFLLFRFNILGWKSAPENSSFMIARRGLIKRDDQGDVVLYDSGRNRLHIMHYRHLVPVHFGDRFVELGSHDFVVDGVTWRRSFTLRWRIPKDKKLIERTVTSVSDQNWWDGAFNQLTTAIKEKAIGQLSSLLAHCRINPVTNLPEFDPALAEQLFGEAISPYGGKYFELIAAPVSRTDAQLTKDGSLAIASAIATVKRKSLIGVILGWLRRH
jgi:hypothetical protein